MKYFTKEVKIALTAIAALVLLFYGINFLKGINLFKTSNTYCVAFQNISGLTVSSPVYANGYSVGIVREIHYDYNHSGSVVVLIDLNKEMRVPVGTKAELETEMLGGVKMNLVLGQNVLQHLSPGDTLQGGMYSGALSKMEAMIPVVERMLPKLDSIMASLNKLLADPALTATVHHTEAITANLEKSTVQLNKLLGKDVPQLTRRLNAIGENVETITGNLKGVDLAGTMADVQQTIQQTNRTITTLNTRLESKDNSLGLLLNDRGMYDNMTQMFSSANSLLIDLKEHPKRYVHFSIFGKKDK